MSKKNSAELDTALSSYYHGEEQVTALIMLKVDTKEADNISIALSGFDQVSDVFMVTGDVDIIFKAKFSSYGLIKKFVMDNLASVPGIKETQTLMVVTTYKEGDKIIDIGDGK